MGKDYQHSFKRAVQIQNWRDASDLFDEVISAAGLTSAETEQAQADAGRRAAEYMNAKDRGGKKV